MSTPKAPTPAAQAALERLQADVAAYAAMRQPCVFTGHNGVHCPATYHPSEAHSPGYQHLDGSWCHGSLGCTRSHGKYQTGHDGWQGPPPTAHQPVLLHRHEAESYADMTAHLSPELAEWGPVPGTAVTYHGQQPSPYHTGRSGKVVAWGVSARQRDVFTQGHAGIDGFTRIGPGDYEALCDSEGPVVEWDDEPGSRDWYPGQSMGTLHWDGGWHQTHDQTEPPSAEPGRDAMQVIANRYQGTTDADLYRPDMRPE